MDQQNPIKGEHYNLRWNNYTSNLIQIFSEHQHHETLVDVTLTCEGQFIKAHKLILSACSAFFEDMFKIHSNVQHPIIVLNSIKFSHLKHILEFIYHGEVKILDEDLEGVLALGESFQVKGLSSVKIKHQISTPDRPSSKLSTPDSVNSTHTSVPNKLRRQQKDNVKNISASDQGKSIDQSSRSSRKVSDNSVKETHVEEQNGKEDTEPVLKTTKNPRDHLATGYIYNPHEAKQRKIVKRRKMSDNSSLPGTLDMLYQPEDEDDDLQVIEINEDPIDTSDDPKDSAL
ncbi:hypothetical protein NQ318_006645 [Aromia moschata]|uniref:BTB domain-containing protein n=1 Tax=Aromia moschata TaxID=1265417 RepID=A0AAV8YQZ3_9CUCU|nr:hypothetical protein NQ318_006645 [Aromia moschata]